MTEKIPEIHRLCADIPGSLWFTFKQVASKRFIFERGYSRLGIIEAIEIYVWMMNFRWDLFRKLERIGNKKFKDIKDPTERHKAIMEAALIEYIENHEND